MISLSLWAHIASLIAFLGLGYVCLVLQRRLQLLREMLGYPPKLRVVYPVELLGEVAGALGAEADFDLPPKFFAPVKTRLVDLADFFRASQVQKIKATMDLDGETVILEVSTPEKTAGNAPSEAVKNLFAGRVKIKLH